MKKETTLKAWETTVLVVLVASALLVLPVFGPHIILTGSAVAMVGCMGIYHRHNRQSVLVPVSLTSGLAALAAVSLFGP